MKFSSEQASSLGLVVGGKSGTALVNPTFGFAGRRIYVDGGVKAIGLRGPCIHLSGFTAEECEALKAMPNPKDEYSARILGFLALTPENLKAAAAIVREATSPAYEPASSSKVASAALIDAIFQAAAK